MSLIDPWLYDYDYSRAPELTPRQINRMEKLDKENNMTKTYTTEDFDKGSMIRFMDAHGVTAPNVKDN